MPTVVASGQNAYVSFTDATGGAQLTTSTGRFDSWVPNAEDIGVDDVAMGSGLTFKYIYRTDYTASFSISSIPASSLSVGLRLKRWLESGGQVTVATQDLQANTYTCVIAPKQRVRLTYDKTFLEYTMTLPVKNVNAGPMLCLYSSTLGTGYTIVVTPSSVSLGGPVGATTQLTAQVFDANDNPVTGVLVNWSSTNNAIATVSASGVVTAESVGTCSIIASIGSIAVIVPCSITILNQASAVTLATSGSLAFTPGSTYVGTPQVGKSGVPAITVTATILNNSDQTITYVPGMLTWSATGTGVQVVDNDNGTATVTAIAGGQSGSVVCTVTNTAGTNNVIQATAAYSTQTGQPAALVPSTSVLTLTAPGVGAAVSVQTVDPYGVVVP